MQYFGRVAGVAALALATTTLSGCYVPPPPPPNDEAVFFSMPPRSTPPSEPLTTRNDALPLAVETRSRSLLPRIVMSTLKLAEPLTEREQRILRYLPTMLTNAEIGAEVFVSLNTVKTHLRSIYRKLDANGRADAVERARRLGLLPAGIKRPRVVQRV